MLNPYTPFPGALSKKKLFLGAARKRVLRREKSFFSDNPFATEQVDTGIERPPTPYENEFD